MRPSETTPQVRTAAEVAAALADECNAIPHVRGVQRMAHDLTKGVEAEMGVGQPFGDSEQFDEFTGPCPPSNTPAPSGARWADDARESLKRVDDPVADTYRKVGRWDRNREVRDALKAEPERGQSAEYVRGWRAAMVAVESALFPIQATNPNLCGYCGVNAVVDDPLGRCPECLKEAGERIDRRERFREPPQTIGGDT